MRPPLVARPRPRRCVGPTLLAAALAVVGCVKAYDLTVDNRTVTSLTLRIYSLQDDSTFSQYPDRVFNLPPNRPFRLPHAIVATGKGDRRLFEFRRPDEQLVDSYVVTDRELEQGGGRLTVPRALAGIPRGAPPAPGYVDSTPQEHVDFIPLFPEDSTGGGQGEPTTGGDSSAEPRAR